jgi:hypothetical protein
MKTKFRAFLSATLIALSLGAAATPALADDFHRAYERRDYDHRDFDHRYWRDGDDRVAVYPAPVYPYGYYGYYSYYAAPPAGISLTIPFSIR